MEVVLVVIPYYREAAGPDVIVVPYAFWRHIVGSREEPGMVGTSNGEASAVAIYGDAIDQFIDRCAGASPKVDFALTHPITKGGRQVAMATRDGQVMTGQVEGIILTPGDFVETVPRPNGPVYLVNCGPGQPPVAISLTAYDYFCFDNEHLNALPLDQRARAKKIRDLGVSVPVLEPDMDAVGEAPDLEAPDMDAVGGDGPQHGGPDASHS